jgi:hypothetical protein
VGVSVEATEKRKRPAFQFYPGDWRKDVELRSCSLAARGLWIDLMCVMHECEPYGHLVLHGKPMTPAKIAGQIGVPAATVAKLLAELLENGVIRQTAEGALFSKRMVEDERIRNARADGGKAGSEHGSKGAEHGSKGGRPPTGRGVTKPPLEPPPSSSSSSSSSEKKTMVEPADADPTAPPAPPLKARDLVAEGVEAQAAADWLTLRKAKRLPLTASAWADTKAEGAKLGLSPGQTVAKAVANNWAGFKASWPDPGAGGRPGAPVQADVFAGAL